MSDAQRERCPECGRAFPRQVRFTQRAVLRIVARYARAEQPLTGARLAEELGLCSRGDALNRLRDARRKAWIDRDDSGWRLTAAGWAILEAAE